MKTFNRFFAVIARLKLKRNNYYRRASFIALMSVLLISFQNCSQGKFEIDEGQMKAGISKSDSGSSGSSTGDNSDNSEAGATDDNGVPAPPPVIVVAPPATGGTGIPKATAAQVAAENARRARCKAAIKAPVVTNLADFASKVLNIKSGLGSAESGDMNAANNSITISVDASLGIDNTKFSVADGCSFTTRVTGGLSQDAGKLPVFTSGIDLNGNNVVADESVASRKAAALMDETIMRTNPNNNNNLEFGGGATSLSFNLNIRQDTQDRKRQLRCVEGVAYYKYRVEVTTENLDANITAPLQYDGLTTDNKSAVSTDFYVRVNVGNACWKETNFVKLLSSTQFPAKDAKFGTALAVDGDWAAAVSDLEGGNGYVYIFRKVSKVWTTFQKLKGSNGNGTRLTGVTIKGSTLVVASGGDGLYKPANGTIAEKPGYPGFVYIYSLGDSQITAPSQTIANPKGKGTKFGASIALSSENGSLIIGDSYSEGIIYRFIKTGASFTYSGTAADSLAGNATGMPVGLLGFGANMVYQNDKLFVAAYSGGIGYAGSVHMYDSNFDFSAKNAFIPAAASVTTKAQFGYAIAYDGTSLAIGAYENATGGMNKGSVHYFKTLTDTAPKILPGNADEERMGVSLAFAGDSLYIGSRGGAASSGHINRFKKTDMADSAKGYSAKVFIQRSQTQSDGEGFSYAMAPVEDADSATLFVSAQTKQFKGATVDDDRANAGTVFMYEVK